VIFTIKDARSGCSVKCFIGEKPSVVSNYANKEFEVTDGDSYFDTEQSEGASYMFQNKAVLWIGESSAGNSVDLYKVLHHEILHVCFYWNNYLEDDEIPERYDVALKSEANFIELSEWFFGEGIKKIISRCKKKSKKRGS
jgi:hypothetical protein